MTSGFVLRLEFLDSLIDSLILPRTMGGRFLGVIFSVMYTDGYITSEASYNHWVLSDAKNKKNYKFKNF